MNPLWTDTALDIVTRHTLVWQGTKSALSLSGYRYLSDGGTDRHQILHDGTYLVQAVCCVLTKYCTASMYNPTDRIVEACQGQCTNKQSKLMYQVAFYETLSGSMNAQVS